MDRSIMNCVDITLESEAMARQELTGDVRECYDMVVSEIKSQLSKSSSDVYGGLTGNILENGCWHPAIREYVGDDGITYFNSYWTKGTRTTTKEAFVPMLVTKSNEDGEYKSYDYKPSIGQEFFAEYMAAQMTRNSAELKGLQPYSTFSNNEIDTYFEQMMSAMSAVKK